MHRIDLTAFAAEHGVQLRQGRLLAVDADAREVTVSGGGRLAYDVLLVAIGARRVEAVPGALTFGGPADEAPLAALLHDVDRGVVRRVAFAEPAGGAWLLPLYELAIFTAARARAREVADVEVTLVTPDDAPLSLFGPQASAAIADLLRASGVRLLLGTTPLRVSDGELELSPQGRLAVDRVVSLPHLLGPGLAGLPQRADGFIPTDAFGRVPGLDRVFAAGDATTYPVKLGGIAAQQADASASAIAALAGAPGEPEPFRPVLRGLLLTGLTARRLEAPLAGTGADGPAPRSVGTWSPATKVSARYLAPYLESHVEHDLSAPAPEEGIEVEIPLHPEAGRPIEPVGG